MYPKNFRLRRISPLIQAFVPPKFSPAARFPPNISFCTPKIFASGGSCTPSCTPLCHSFVPLFPPNTSPQNPKIFASGGLCTPFCTPRCHYFVPLPKLAQNGYLYPYLCTPSPKLDLYPCFCTPPALVPLAPKSGLYPPGACTPSPKIGFVPPLVVPLPKCVISCTPLALFTIRQ